MGPFHLSNLQPGFEGTRQTLAAMAELVRQDSRDPRIRALAHRLIESCNGHEFECEATRLFEFVRDAITFRKDPVGQERVAGAPETLANRVGDCDDKVVLLGSLLGASGHRSRFVVIGTDPQNFAHVYLEAQTQRGWLPLDPTPEQSQAGWEAQGFERWTYEVFPRGGGMPYVNGGFSGLGFMPSAISFPTDSGSSGGGIDWGSIIQTGIQGAPNIIAAARGNPQQWDPRVGAYVSAPISPGSAAVAARYGDSSLFANIDTGDVLKWGLIGLGIFILLKKIK